MRPARLPLCIALVAVVLVSLSGPAQSKIHTFDMGPEGSPVWKGFTEVTAKTVYTKKSGYGWRKPAGRGITHRLRGVPDALACDLVGATDSPYSYYVGAMEFLLDVPNGEYTVYLLASDYTGGRGASRGTRYVPRSITVRAEGQVKVAENWTRERWHTDYVFRSMLRDYRRGDNVYDKYVAPCFVPKVFDVNVTDGRLDLAFAGATVNGLIVYPAAEAEKGRAFIAELDRKRRESFDYEDETPRPTGQLEGVTGEDRKRGYVVFHPHYMDTVYPFDLPKAEQLGKDLRALASLGEFEPITFAVHPLRDLGKCRVTVSELKSQDGATIAPDRWDVRVVRYLELPHPRGARRYRIQPLLLIRTNESDIEQGINKQFWLTIKVPENARPGKYKGAVTLKPESAPETRLALKLLVLPYKLLPLEDNKRYQGVWHTYQKYDLPLDKIAADLRDHGINVIHCAPVPRAKLVDGQIVLTDTKDTENHIETYRKAGFPMKLLVWQGALGQAYGLANEPTHDAEWLKARGGHSDHQVKKSFSPEFDDVYKKLAKAVDDLFKQRGWPEIYFYDAGEGGTEGYWGIWTETHLLKLQKEAGVKGTTSVVGLAALEAELPYLAVVQISSSSAPPSVRERVRKAGTPLWLYGFGANRFQRGFLFWNSGAEGCAVEGYAHVYGEPYNEFDGAHAVEGRVWPAPDGPLPSLAWERIREGIDDCKYLSHLDLLIKEAMKSGSRAAKDAAQAATEELDGVTAEINPDFAHYRRHGNPEPYTLDVWRWKVARRIMKLQKAMQGK